MRTFCKTKSVVVSLLLLLALIFSVPNQAAAQPLPDVAVLGADNASGILDVQTKLIATGQFSSVSEINTSSITPTLAELQAFDAVLIWINISYADPITLGNNLADYHDAGDGVVTAMLEGLPDSGLHLEGRWETDTYKALVGGVHRTGLATLGTVHDPAHPIMAGVTSFDGGSGSLRPDSTGLTVGTILIAEWSDGMPLVAVKECFNGRPRVDLGFHPPSNDVYSYSWLSATDGALLMANALSYVANPPDADGDGIWDCTDTPSVHNLTQLTDHFRIQEAIDLAVNGDEISVDPGT